jgi:hypothetical protein
MMYNVVPMIATETHLCKGHAEYNSEEQQSREYQCEPVSEVACAVLLTQGGPVQDSHHHQDSKLELDAQLFQQRIDLDGIWTRTRQHTTHEQHAISPGAVRDLEWPHEQKGSGREHSISKATSGCTEDQAAADPLMARAAASTSPSRP